MSSTLKSLAYKAINLATFGRGIKRNFSGEDVRFPPRWCRYFKTDYEPEMFEFLRNYLKKGETFLDIGAHIGLFSVVAAKIVGETGRVMSFEPTPKTREVLKQMVELNGCAEVVEIRDEAISSSSGMTTFYDSGDEISVTNSLVQNERTQSGIDVKTLTLDELVTVEQINRLCFKVDVEGAELELLRGARRTMTEIRPIVRFSVHPPFIPDREHAVPDIWETIDGFGYSILFKGERMSKASFCSREALFDVDLVPNESLENLLQESSKRIR